MDDFISEDTPSPIKQRALEIISEMYKASGMLDAMCSGWPCTEVQRMACRIAELEAECDGLKATQCRCNHEVDETKD
jgi:methylmalonyl-CoA mutase N-terminal domain/subunit